MATKQPCPECGKEITKSYLPNHLRTQHGVYGGASGKPRLGAQKLPVKHKQQPQQPPTEFMRVLPYKVIVDTEGNLYIAEPIGRTR